MSRTIRIGVLVLAVLALAGLIVPFIIHSRVKSDRVRCEDHLRELGLIGVQHASPPGQGLPTRPRDELPPGTFLNPTLSPDRRMSWYAYLLNVFNEGPVTTDPTAKHRKPVGLAEALQGFAAKEPWDAPANTPLANYRLKVAICPAQFRELPADSHVLSNYIANGGIGLDTPGLTFEQAGKRGGAYRYDGPTPLKAFTDGLRQTAQFLETNENLAPWLQGGPGTLRALDPANSPFLGLGRPFGGCHPGGMYASMADGSVQFIKETIEPAIFQALLTRAGGLDEVNFDAP